MLCQVVFCCVLLIHSCLTSKFPSTLTKCDRKNGDFDTCLSKAVEDAIHQLNRPIKDAYLPNLEPLEVSELVIGAGTGAVNFVQNYKQIKVFGFSRSNCSRVKMDFEKRNFTMECLSPRIKLEFDVEVKGKILVLPIQGTGPGSLILDELSYVNSFVFDEYTNKSRGENFFKVINSTFLMDTKLMIFNLQNIFGNDKALNDNMNKVLNENWKIIFDDIKGNYEEALAQISMSIFNNFLGKVSVLDLFGSE